MQDMRMHLTALLSSRDRTVGRCLESLRIPRPTETIAPETLDWPPEIVERAFALSRRLGNNEVGSAHLLLAFLDSRPEKVRAFLEVDGATCARLREALHSVLSLGE
ncbi:MAG: Clp protease N-terminal domain-containing protein [Candidatus Eremiobacteraeota bacterium]|nr:Clp protease N-terminal domain-containing protein [Candidatus Eremiobacteraeota bacterium]